MYIPLTQSSQLRAFHPPILSHPPTHTTRAQFDVGIQQWRMQPESSFNTDGRYPTFDLMQPYGGLANRSEAWLAPQPGGSGTVHTFAPRDERFFHSKSAV